ncbi:contact-dependent growth inhibition system immunity protein [Kitasatospora purpeofusca]|uniref:contact-dependent growth inhibition system immunity protein n=1 Tax=Kitasatospora purpeofusca TaxID=67352 RepID=UPI0036D2226D
MIPRQDFDEDFGLTGLTKYLAMHLDLRDEPGCLELATALLEHQGNPAYAEEVLDDVERLTRSPLTDDALSALWLAACNARFDPARSGLRMRVWLDRLAETCTAHLRRNDPSFEPARSRPADHPDLREAVLAELRGVAPALAEKAVGSLCVPPLPQLVPSLEAAVTALGPDLGFRLVLRAMKVYFVRIGPARLARLEGIGRLLGYHDRVVEDGNLNIRSDLED